jgi:uncharacterized protein
MGRVKLILLIAAVLLSYPGQAADNAPPAAAPAQGASLADYVGVYAAGDTSQPAAIDRVSVALGEMGLTIESERNPPTELLAKQPELLAKQPDQFSLREPGIAVRFERDMAGRVVALSFAGVRLIRVRSQPDRLFTGSNRLYQRAEADIPMRDGVRLHTVIMRPQDGPAGAALPFLIERTPYGTDGISSRAVNATKPELASSGYIFVYQDIRGRGRSEGTFVMMRPPSVGHTGAAASDESTDTWDTVDWLVKNVSGNNGRVGVTGMSYAGWLALNAALARHPAIKAVAAQAPMVDAWIGDDFFHNGALRQSFVFDYAQKMEADRPDLSMQGAGDAYDFFLSKRNFEDAMAAVKMDALPTVRNIIAHPSYDAFWRNRALQRKLGRANVPMLLLGGWFDQEDMWGPQGAYAAIKAGQPRHGAYLVLGPWNHGGWAATERNRGVEAYGAEPGEFYRKTIEAPFFENALKSKAGFRLRGIASFRTGGGSWKFYDQWPPLSKLRRADLYLGPGSALSFLPPGRKRAVVATYRSDPAHPVPYQPRPIRPISGDESWKTWLLQDQRFLNGRADIARFRGPKLRQKLVVTGEIIADLFASTTGTDADWVAKLIDVFPDGKQMIVAAEIMRGRYRTSFAAPRPIAPNRVLEYRWSLHGVDHIFESGHRLMISVQSSWFPLYDRNPQTFVRNIASAEAAAYKPQTIRILGNSRLILRVAK